MPSLVTRGSVVSEDGSIARSNVHSLLDLARHHPSGAITHLTNTGLVPDAARRTVVFCDAATVRTSDGIIGNRYFAITATRLTDSGLITLTT